MSLRALAVLALPGAAVAQFGSVRPPVRPFDVMKCSTGEPVLTTPSLTLCDYRDVVDTITGMWRSLSPTCTAAECQQAEWAGCVLRMAGHDFMDFDPRFGRGSDGCTNLIALDNAGLQPCLENGMFGTSLKDAYQRFCTRISLADFIVIAAEAVIMATRSLAVPDGVAPVDFSTSFRFGRTTAKDCPGAGSSLPNPEGGCDEVQRIFVSNMGLDWRGAAALMGVHTLGRADAVNSGYDGWWTPPEDARKFNIAYYRNLLMNGWMADKAVNGNPNKNQWRRSDAKKPGMGPERQMMLNTDMCLAYNNPSIGYRSNAQTDTCCSWTFQNSLNGISGDYCGTPGTVNDLLTQHQLCCDGQVTPDCGKPDGADALAFQAVKEFATNDAAWISAFRQAWTKATENGFSNLQALQPCTTPSPTTTTPAPPPTTTTRVNGGIPFDCAAEYGIWQRSWSAQMQVWCCLNVGKGCPSPVYT